MRVDVCLACALKDFTVQGKVSRDCCCQLTSQGFLGGIVNHNHHRTHWYRPEFKTSGCISCIRASPFVCWVAMKVEMHVRTGLCKHRLEGSTFMLLCGFYVHSERGVACGEGVQARLDLGQGAEVVWIRDN